ncbi:MAG TPA: bifunctional precorrin-2 dehydrogenase/sirohydrochlorin ferrochelatase [Ktedonobacterales bacterium]|nr:bifunctional precorrin-2 dehydrogenase/sirohydrochlorin ferrochelatase [Ktedonobacterales bacterium]
MANYFPVMLDVRGRRALVVGGDRLAAEKAAALVASGGRVTVIAPEFSAEVWTLAQRERIVLCRKMYEPGDLEGAFVVVAAVTHQPELVEAIWAETQRRGQLVNIVDVPERCSFIMPSILRRGQLTIAVSTEGASPGLAKRIRQQLEGIFPPVYSAFLHLATIARAHLRTGGVPYDRRDAFAGEYYESPVLSQLERDDRADAAATTADLLRSYGVDVPATQLEEALASDVEA